MSLTPPNNLSAMSLTPVNSFLAVSLRIKKFDHECLFSLNLIWEALSGTGEEFNFFKRFNGF